MILQEKNENSFKNKKKKIIEDNPLINSKELIKKLEIKQSNYKRLMR